MIFPNKEADLSKSVVGAMDDLPILERLQFAKNLIFDKGGDGASVPQDPTLVVATEVITGVIQVLKAHPRAAKLRHHER